MVYTLNGTYSIQVERESPADDWYHKFWPVLFYSSHHKTGSAYEIHIQSPTYRRTQTADVSPTLWCYSRVWLSMLPDQTRDATTFSPVQNEPTEKKSSLIFHKTGKAGNDNRYSQIFTDLVGQWLTEPTCIPTFEKCRDTFLSKDIIPLDYTSLVREAIIDQTSIGWIHAMRGFLSQKWVTLAGTYCNAPNAAITTRFDGGFRIQRSLKAWDRLTTDLWCGRNEALHDTKEAMGQNLKALVDVEISKLHCDSDALLSADSPYCEISLQRLLRSSASTKRRWLHRVKQSREKKTALQAKQPRITIFFHWEAPIPPPTQPHRVLHQPSTAEHNGQGRVPLFILIQEKLRK